jgi:hemerythrin
MIHVLFFGGGNMRFVWSAELETGVRSIDLQHEELIGMLNELQDAHAAGSAQTVLHDVLRRLDAYIVFHFATEEALMADLPAHEAHADTHLQQHRLFIEQVSALRQQALSDGPQAMGQLVDYLTGWLYDHILKTDRKLAALLNARAAQQQDSERGARSA